MGDAKQLVEIERVFLAKAGMRPQSQVGQNFLNDVGLVNEGRDGAVRRVRRLRGRGGGAAQKSIFRMGRHTFVLLLKAGRFSYAHDHISVTTRSAHTTLGRSAVCLSKMGRSARLGIRRTDGRACSVEASNTMW